jgi:PPOX class probable F420-dependent enzyme
MNDFSIQMCRHEFGGTITSMAGGSCRSVEDLPEHVLGVLDSARRAALATVDSSSLPHVVPVCYAIVNGDIVMAIDDKPKSGAELARVRNIRANPNVTVMFDRWDEDWRALAWVMVRGTARLEPPGTGAEELAARYEQYRRSAPQGEVIAVSPVRLTWWSFSDVR